MVTKPKIIKASLISPFFILLPIAVIAAIVILENLLSVPNISSNDDAPTRAAGIILFGIIPILYPVLVIFMGLVGYILNHFKLLLKKNIYLVYGVISLLIGTGLGLPSPIGIEDRIIGICIFIPITSLCLLSGAYIWWKIVVPRNEK